ncbi:TATA element modulatory factor 1 [Batrachochytrium dendrobatidis]
MGEINKRNEVIRKLKDELREIKHQAEEATKKLEIKSKQKEEADISAFTEKENALRQEIESANRQLEDDTASNREEEALLRKKKFKIESEVENWIHKYDQDMEEKQAEIDDITVIFMEEKAHLDELQERYTDLQKEFEKITEEKRIAEEKKKASYSMEGFPQLCCIAYSYYTCIYLGEGAGI